jgi:hypothetical protein
MLARMFLRCLIFARIHTIRNFSWFHPISVLSWLFANAMVLKVLPIQDAWSIFLHSVPVAAMRTALIMLESDRRW